ncbi:MAG: hypothetical protein EP347_09260 [Alphaproteobacteria bacterium]|nr:MAG: hypothetical protein EP347_09260 [Alphaproteobacteria bacterium]
MRWFGIGLGVGLLFLIAGYALGLFLPASYQANVSRVIDAPRSDVWAAINDYQDNPVTGRMAQKIIPLEEGGNTKVWVEDIGASQITVRDLESERNTVLRREARDSQVPMYATITIRLGDREGKTAVHVLNETRINNGTWQVPIFRLSLFFTRSLEDGLEDYLDGLEADLDSHQQDTLADKN